MRKVAFLIVALVLVGCGNSDCPSGVNTTNPNCPGYVGNGYQYNNGNQYNPNNPSYPYQQPYQQQPYQQPGYGYPQQPGYGYGYPQQPQPYPYQQPRYY